MEMGKFIVQIEKGDKPLEIKFESNNNRDDIRRVSRAVAKANGVNLKYYKFEVKRIG